MTQPIFRRIEDEEGNVTYEEVPVTDVLTEDVIRETQVYKELLSESIERRQTLADLKKAQLNTQPKPESKPEPEPEPVDARAEEATIDFDPDQLFEQFVERLTTRQQEEAKAQAERQATVQTVGKKYNVNPALLRGNTVQELESHAEQLSKELLQFKDIGTNPASDSIPDIGDLMKNVDKRLGWGE